jgi:type III secretory pathway component EscU
VKKSAKKPAKEMAGPPKTKKRRRTRKSSAKAQAGSFPGYGGYTY